MVRRTLTSRRSLSALTIAAGTMVVLAAIVLGQVGILDRHPGTSVAEARSFLQSVTLPDKLPVADGQFLHLRTEVYRRYGPKAAEIMALPGTGPENTIQEGWYQFGPNQTVTRYRETLSEPGGRRVQESVRDQTNTRTVDSRTGAVLSEAVVTGPAKANAEAATAARLKAALDAGVAKPVSQTSESLTIELRQDWKQLFPQGRTSSPQGFAIPYAEDLAPVELISRVTLRRDGFVLLDEHSVRTATGRQVLIESRRTTVVEITNTAPTGAFGGGQ